MRPLIAAFGLFTIIPMPTIAQLDRRTAGRAMAAFPWVGLLLGAAAGAVLWGVTTAGAAPLLGAALALAVGAGATGALHLDGLADTADGLGSRKSADEALAIMRKSDIGPMGVVTLLFALLVGVAALASMAPQVAAGAVAVSAMTGRLAVVVATVSRASARREGFGALFAGVTAPWSAAVNVALAAAIALGAGWLLDGLPGLVRFGLAFVAALAGGWLWGSHLRRRFGGQTGDTFGSIVEVGQVLFLVVAALL